MSDGTHIPEQHWFPAGQVERPKGRRGYRWTQGYSHITPEGLKSYPWLTLLESRMHSKEQGYHARIHKSLQGAETAWNREQRRADIEKLVAEAIRAAINEYIECDMGPANKCDILCARAALKALRDHEFLSES